MHKIYLGYDVHAYTHQMNFVAESYQSQFQGELSNNEFEMIIQELQEAYGPKVTYMNLRQVFRNGSIVDPQVPCINVAIVLKTVWCKVKTSEQSLKSYFNQTLDDIGMTCIQGISHRLLIDFIAFCTD